MSASPCIRCGFISYCCGCEAERQWRSRKYDRLNTDQALKHLASRMNYMTLILKEVCGVESTPEHLSKLKQIIKDRYPLS